MLADTAIADDQTDPETFLNLRREIEVAERAAEEMPLVIELLESRLGQMESEDRVSEQDATRIRNDELFLSFLVKLSQTAKPALPILSSCAGMQQAAAIRPGALISRD